MKHWATLTLSLMGTAACFAAAPAYTDAQVSQVPTPPILASVHSAAQRDGWLAQTRSLRAAAVRAYQLGNLPAAEAWFYVYQWANLCGETDSQFIPAWIQAVNAAKVGHANMPAQYAMTGRPLGAVLSPALEDWLLGNTAFSAEFFGVLTPVDYLPNVFKILDEIYRRDPAKFSTYAHLALALAVVYDVPPPPDWPHGQVSAASLPRKFPSAVDAFAWWTHQEELGRTYHRLSRLGAAELKFVVDAAAPLSELEWSQNVANYPLNQLAKAYTMVRYRFDRVSNRVFLWPGKKYRMPDVLAEGGICVDQAFFATEVGKARGVPTLLFSGVGNDARHAWFGFLDGDNKWQLDAGRYAEQRFVTGYARDPQTWGTLTDHDLQFLQERFHELPSFRQSQVHAMFAASFLTAGAYDAATVAARKAVTLERRNLSGWETLIAAGQKSGRDAKAVEGVIHEAANAFQRFPDLEASYVNRIADSLRARGQTSDAEAVVQGIADKNQSRRSDLSFAEARATVQRAIETKPLAEQIRAYNTVVDTVGRGAGIGFFDQIVIGFAEHLMTLNQRSDALAAVERARRTLKVEPGSQLEAEFIRVVDELRKTRP